MKLLGLIGGMSWENTIEYYRGLNALVKERLGGWSSAKILLYSVNFEEILTLENEERWEEVADKVIHIGKKLAKAKCEAIMLCSNTIHKVASRVQEKIGIPIINVIDETARIIKEKGIQEVGLLGTRFTMEGRFYVERLRDKHDLDPLIPEEGERTFIHDIIYNHLDKGIFLDETKRRILEIIDSLTEDGAS